MTRQLDLFAGPQSLFPEAPAVQPALPAPDVAAIAARLPEGLHLGTSSWYFPGWAGIVWRHAASETVLAHEGLAAYARHPLLRSVSIDRAWHAPLPIDVWRHYAEQVPQDFRFVVKAPAAITDPVQRDAQGRPGAANAHFLDPAWAIDHFVGPVLYGLGRKAGPLVFQFPPLPREQAHDARGFAQRLQRFLAALPRRSAEGRQPLYAVEVRDPGLLGTRLDAALNAGGARLCLALHDRMPPVADQARQLAGLHAGPLVVRWSLHAGRRYREAQARYAPFDRIVEADPATRAGLATLARAALAAGQPAYLIVNNKAEGCAPLTLIELARQIAIPPDHPGAP